MDVLYTAEATAWGGREGRSATTRGNLALALAIPEEWGGPGGDGTNPEELSNATRGNVDVTLTVVES